MELCCLAGSRKSDFGCGVDTDITFLPSHSLAESVTHSNSKWDIFHSIYFHTTSDGISLYSSSRNKLVVVASRCCCWPATVLADRLY